MKADFESLLLGVCVGDALGLPAEGLSPRRIQRRWRGEWKMRLIAGRGMISDDTEHTVMVALALLKHPQDAQAFQHDLGRRFRWWFAALPPGTGLATARACLKLWLGFGPDRSGVFSAGNGPAMRSAIIGAFFADHPQRRREYVRASTRLTHTDPKAEVAAVAVAEAAAWEIAGGSQSDLLTCLRSLSEDAEWSASMTKLEQAIQDQRSVGDFVQALGLSRGVSGYAYASVPVALYAFLRHRGDFAGGLISVLNCGGDTDTAGAIAGALLGLSGSAKSIPAEWMNHVSDWPISPENLRLLSKCFDHTAHAPFRWWHWLFMPIRNLLLLLIVLAHGFVRLVR